MTTSRLSYASSPESDLELSPGPSASLSLGNLPQLVKSSSDPSIATNQDNLEHDREEMVEGMPPPYTVRTTTRSIDNSHEFHLIHINRNFCLLPYNHARVVGENSYPADGINMIVHPSLPVRRPSSAFKV